MVDVLISKKVATSSLVEKNFVVSSLEVGWVIITSYFCCFIKNSCIIMIKIIINVFC